jgi:hypothetical protein
MIKTVNIPAASAPANATEVAVVLKIITPRPTRQYTMADSITHQSHPAQEEVVY